MAVIGMKRRYKYNPQKGDKFNRLTFIEEAEPLISRRQDRADEKIRMCKVECDCGNISIKRLNDVVKGAMVSCGCYIKESSHNSKKLIEGIGVNDYDGFVVGTNYKMQSYAIWVDMIARCYSPAVQKRLKTYKDCFVCDEWLYFSNFKRWFDAKYNPDTMKGWHLDKDLLIPNNRIYRPEACCFLPNEINALYKGDLKRALPRGVYQLPKGRYCARMGDKNDYLGSFATIAEANNKYQEARKVFIKKKADKYKDSLSPLVYDVLVNYKPKLM